MEIIEDHVISVIQLKFFASNNHYNRLLSSSICCPLLHFPSSFPQILILYPPSDYPQILVLHFPSTSTDPPKSVLQFKTIVCFWSSCFRSSIFYQHLHTWQRFQRRSMSQHSCSTVTVQYTNISWRYWRPLTANLSVADRPLSDESMTPAAEL